MGGVCSTNTHNLDNVDLTLNVDENFSKYRDKQLDINGLVEHYMPPEFPLVDMITTEDIETCNRSWNIISTASADGVTSPMLLELIDEFYDRLLKRANKFKKIFSNVRERASVLTKAITFILRGNQLPIQIRLQKYSELGCLHRQLGISHWMFSMYMATLIGTVSFVLKDHADLATMESWTRVCSYTLRFLLEAVIRPQFIRKLEYAANYDGGLEDVLKKREDLIAATNMSKMMTERSSALSKKSYAGEHRQKKSVTIIESI